MKAVLYARVSSREQAEEGYSIPAQQKLLNEYAQKKGLEVSKEFVDVETAKTTGRTHFNELLKYFQAHPDVKTLLVEKTDRLYRNFRDFVTLEEFDLEIHLVKEGEVLSKDSRSHVKFIHGIKVLMAKNYIDNLSEEVRKGQKEKIAQGWLPAKSPLGYKTVGETGHKIHVLDEKAAPHMKRAFELYATGSYSLSRLAKTLYEEGLRTRGGYRLVKSRLHQLLSDPFYCGRMRWMGTIYDGKHEPLVSRQVFDHVRDLLTRKAAPKYSKHSPLFKGLLKCVGCGGTVTWELQKGHWYGHCNHYRHCDRRKFVRQEAVEEQLLPYLERLTFKQGRLVEWIKKALKDSHKDEMAYHNQALEDLNKRHEQAQKRLDALYDDKIDGKISPEFYEMKFKLYSEEKAATSDSIKRHSAASTKYLELGTNILDLAQKAREIYLRGSMDGKRQLLSLVFSNLQLDGATLCGSYSPAFERISQTVKSGKWLGS